MNIETPILAAPSATNPCPVIDPKRIPARRYYDEAFYKAEVEHLWPNVWQMACRLEQIPQVGDWIEYENLGRSVLIVHTREGIRAFHNACRHRGVQLASGHGNCKSRGFICPFHGWRWNAEGENTFVYGRHLFSDDVLDPADLALVPCRAETAIGCVFINFSDDAPSLNDSIGPLLGRLDAHGASSQRAEWCYGTVLPANWKTAMEAFMEGYHVLRTHPQLHQALGALYNSMYGQDTGGLSQPVNMNASVRDNIRAQFKHLELLSEGMAGMVHAKEIEIARQLVDVELPEDPQQAVMMWYGIVQDQVSKQLQARGEPVPDLNAVAVSDPVQAVEFIFPNYFVLPFFTGMSAYRIRPLGPESCLFELWSLTHFKPGEEPEPVMEPIMLPHDSEQFPPIPRQDYDNIPRQQIGLRSAGFESMRLSAKIEGLISNYHRVIDGYLAGADPASLATATHALAGNFDGPIKDLGL